MQEIASASIAIPMSICFSSSSSAFGQLRWCDTKAEQRSPAQPLGCEERAATDSSTMTLTSVPSDTQSKRRQRFALVSSHFRRATRARTFRSQCSTERRSRRCPWSAAADPHRRNARSTARRNSPPQPHPSSAEPCTAARRGAAQRSARTVCEPKVIQRGRFRSYGAGEHPLATLLQHLCRHLLRVAFAIPLAGLLVERSGSRQVVELD
eukprot:COSAG06_NODE_4839_length_3918_cov_1.490966_4_plen_209_part_00